MANERQNKSFMSFFKFNIAKCHSKSKPNYTAVKSPMGKIIASPSKDFEESETLHESAKSVVYGDVDGRRSVDIHCNGEGINDVGMVKLPAMEIILSGFDEKERRGNAVVEGRRSVSRVEMNLDSMAAFLAVKVIVADMPGFMQAHAFRCARQSFDSLEKFSPKHMAFNIKKEFDKGYGPAWHCIVGSSFGSFVTHSTGCFLYFSIEKLCVLVFRTKVLKALD